ncbi:MAG TPA: protein phosphatase 2C domain-containing protein [Puia sp.]|nr:protein phosphatase 2C domain-containing protein [Puia sp.]
MMIPEKIYYLFELGHKIKQEDYLWPIPGMATGNDRVFIVCDGSGSYENGEIASKLICQFMAANVLKFREKTMSAELIDRLLVEAQDELIAYAPKHGLDTDLATTFSMLILYDQKALISWCGDSPVYHLRGGEILFRTDNNSLFPAQGIMADGSPISAETKWIEDVQAGDYFLICSKSLRENLTDDDIKLLTSQNDQTNIDLARSFKQLAFEKTPGNYSMYLIKVNEGTEEKFNKGETTAIGKQNIAIRKQITAIREQAIAIREQAIAMKEKTSGNVTPLLILAMTIVGMFILFIYFRNVRPSAPEPAYKKQTTLPGDVLREDSVPSAFVISTHRKPVLKATDSVKNIGKNPPAAPPDENSAAVSDEENTGQTETPADQRKQVAQLMIKLTTDESCKLKITNIDLNQEIDWDLSQNDDGTLYLKPGKYSIVATSEISSSKTKTYDFDVKPGYAHTKQNLHIRF